MWCPAPCWRGMVLRGWTQHLKMDTASLEHKFDAVGYGLFIPIFFVSSGGRNAAGLAGQASGGGGALPGRGHRRRGRPD